MTQWEFAVITHHKDETWVSYLHPDGTVTVSPRWKPTSKGIPVFERILAYLGGGEWELVSVQHGLSGTGTLYGGELRANDVKAYLKRPVLAGRRTNQPPIPNAL